MTIKWKATTEDRKLILQIVDRASQELAKRGTIHDPLSITMDVAATHLNGCPLLLKELLAADDFNFWHDIRGISRHINRSNGKLEGCFLPRFAAPRGGQHA